MRLYDTARGEVVPFEPGPVVTDVLVRHHALRRAPTSGHAQVYLTFDILQRRLRDLGHETRLVRNVTDVDDDILRKARELGVHYLDLAAEEMARFDANMAALGLLPVYREPRATSAIPDILSLIGHVLDGGHAYSVGRGGVLRHLVLPPLRAGQPPVAGRDAGAGGRAGRQPRRPQQARPARLRAVAALGPRRAVVGVALGPGPARLAHRVLGPGHARARRHRRPPRRGDATSIFPHHECETAQSESATGTTFSRHWLHVGMVGLDGTKMSKSLGNLVFVGDLLKEWEPMAVRLALLAHHYRTDWDWEHARPRRRGAQRLDRWRAAGTRRRLAPAALDDGAPAPRRRPRRVPDALSVLDDEAAAGPCRGRRARRSLGVEL